MSASAAAAIAGSAVTRYAPSMAEAAMNVLSAAMKLSVQERVRVAEKLLESADAEGYEEDSEAAVGGRTQARGGFP